MKHYNLFLISFFCMVTFCGCELSSEARVNSDYIVGNTAIKQKNTNVNVGAENTKTPAAEHGKVLNGESFRVDSFEDNELFSSIVFRNGVITNKISYNTQTKKQESEVTYFYKQNGEFDYSKVVVELSSKGDDLAEDKANRDLITQYGFLKSKDIEFPVADIVADDVGYLSNIFSAADNYHDFEKINQVDGDQRVMKFIGFNKKIRFKPSTITIVVGSNPILIENYELTLKDKYPLKELYKTDEGELVNEYSYKDKRLVKILYRFNDSKNQTYSLERRFEYHKLK
jgi:hypothetical protein